MKRCFLLIAWLAYVLPGMTQTPDSTLEHLFGQLDFTEVTSTVASANANIPISRRINI